MSEAVEFDIHSIPSWDNLIESHAHDHSKFQMSQKNFQISTLRKSYRDNPNETNGVVGLKTYDESKESLWDGSLDSNTKVKFVEYDEGQLRYTTPMVFYIIPEDHINRFRNISNDMTSYNFIGLMDNSLDEKPSNITELYKLNPKKIGVTSKAIGYMPTKGIGVVFPQAVVAVYEGTSKPPLNPEVCLNLSDYFVFDIDLVEPYYNLFLGSETGLNEVIVTDEDGLVVSAYDTKNIDSASSYTPTSVRKYHGFKITSDIMIVRRKRAKYIWVSYNTLKRLTEKLGKKDVILRKKLTEWMKTHHKDEYAHEEHESHGHGYGPGE